jgi:imidazolonepropionase
MLECIHQADATTEADLVPTCLAAHIRPGDFEGSSMAYLQWIVRTYCQITCINQPLRR